MHSYPSFPVASLLVAGGGAAGSWLRFVTGRPGDRHRPDCGQRVSQGRPDRQRTRLGGFTPFIERGAPAMGTIHVAIHVALSLPAGIGALFGGLSLMGATA